MREHAAALGRCFQEGDWPAASAHAELLLGALGSNPSLAVATAHPLGFVHIDLGEFASGRLRLHLWPVPAFHPQQPDWAVHRHGWPLVSLVVRGRIRDERWSVQERDDGARRLYEASYEGERSALVASERTVDARVSDTMVQRPGDVYELVWDAFHCSAAEVPSVTVVWAGVKVAAPVVLGDLDGERRVEYARYELSARELSNVLGGV
jgi:hypothetical protein